jgi:glycosyltransferase involved in cell wall biosynthesis
MLAYAFYENDTRILQYATALAKRGDAVDVIALRRSQDVPEFEVLDNVNVHRIQSRTVNEKGLFAYAYRISTFFLRATFFLARKHQQRHYDLIHVHNVPDFLVFAAISPKLHGVPVILDIHDLLPEFYASKFKISDKSWVFRLLTFVEKCSAAFASRIIIANHLWRDRFVGRSCDPRKCSVVRNHPDRSIFVMQSRSEAKHDERLLLTYPGSLNWHQGLDVAIRAFSRVSDQMPEAEFHIYGEGPAKSALIALAAELRMQGRITFHDFLSAYDIARVMARTDVAIEPKRATSAFGNEALSTKILEFMTLGVPVIASKTKIHAYYYDDSIIKYYENDDEGQLADALVLLRNDPVLRRELAARASEYARDNSWQVRKKEYLQLADSLVENEVQDMSPEEVSVHSSEPITPSFTKQ